MATNEQLAEALQEAKGTIQELEALIAQLSAKPISHGVVLQELKESKSVLVLVDGKMLEVDKPHGDRDLHVNSGDIVRLSSAGQILDSSPAPRLGEITIVESVQGNRAEIDHGGNRKHVFFDSEKMNVRKNDRVLLDGSGSVILENHGHERQRFNIDKSMVTWNDIGGLNDPKRELIEAIELPYKYPEIYKFYEKEPVKGVLLYGPPGCGKTMLGKATASSIAKTHFDDEHPQSGFIYVKGPEILDKYVGIAEQTVRSLFERARRHKEEHGFPAVLFIDEADAILGKRGKGISSDMEKTIVPMFLSEMDGMEQSAAFVILATNRADTLDPAVTREGRVDRQIKIPRPNQEQAEEILKVHFKDMAFTESIDENEVAVHTARELWSERGLLYKIHLKNGNILEFGLPAIASGATLAGIAERSKMIAIRNDIEADRRPTGLDVQDVDAAIESLIWETKQRDLREEIDQFADKHRKSVERIERVF